ncbi:MAG: hypothetical protein BWY81_00056 [Firmicutes bacterium ADurb.Bin467]|nr:MAG: hypothetical protein BWY81_00056 [Firmicutes bacterium ADurb.Bin467]
MSTFFPTASAVPEPALPPRFTCEVKVSVPSAFASGSLPTPEL